MHGHALKNGMACVGGSRRQHLPLRLASRRLNCLWAANLRNSETLAIGELSCICGAGCARFKVCPPDIMSRHCAKSAALQNPALAMSVPRSTLECLQSTA